MKRRGFLKWFGLAPVAAVAAKAAAAVESLPPELAFPGAAGENGDVLMGTDLGLHPDATTVTTLEWKDGELIGEYPSETLTQGQREPLCFGEGALSNLTTSSDNVAIGYGASQNTFYGYNAGTSFEGESSVALQPRRRRLFEKPS